MGSLMTNWITLLKRAHGAGNPAIEIGQTSWSGPELLRYAAGGLEWLANAGVPEGVPVPALLHTDGAAMALLIEEAAGGRPLAPLAPDMPVDDLVAHVQRLDARVIVVQPAYESLGREVAAASGRDLAVTAAPHMLARPLPTPRPSSAAVVLHSSVSARLPKAIYSRHDRLCRRIALDAALQRLDHTAVFATDLPFVTGVSDLMVTLACGAAITTLPQQPADARRALSGRGVTHALVQTATIDELARSESAGGGGAAGVPLRLSALRLLRYAQSRSVGRPCSAFARICPASTSSTCTADRRPARSPA
jgi:acyl-coenzyme A synthetase/AMP-(fatty) acid ligase